MRAEWGEGHESCKHYGWLYESFLGSWLVRISFTSNIFYPFPYKASIFKLGTVMRAWGHSMKKAAAEWQLLGYRGKPCLKTAINQSITAYVCS